MKIKKEHTTITTLTAIILTLIPFTIRTIKNPSITGIESYHYLKTLGLTALETKKQLLIAGFYPVITTLITIILIQDLLRKNKEEEKTILLTTMMLATSSIIISNAGTITPYPLIMMLTTTALWLWQKKPELATITTIPLILIDTISYYATTALIMSISTIKQEKTKKTLKITITLIIIGIITQLITGTKYSYWQQKGTPGLLLILGSIKGFSIIILFLGIIGTIKYWPGKKASPLAITTTALMIISYYDNTAKHLLIIILSYLAAKGINYLIERKWSLTEIKKLSLFIITLTIIFSTITAINLKIKEKPTQELIQATEYLKTLTQEGKILTTKENSIIINSLTNKPTFITHERKTFITKKTKEEMIAEKIYQERNLKEAEEMLKNNNIKYLLIDQEMLNGKIWWQEEQGILFLIKYSNKFIKIYENKGIIIYQVNLKD